MGAGHSVTALYEVKLHEESDGTLATVHVRYADPDSGEVTEIEQALESSDLASEFDEASPSFQLSAVVAEYAEILRESYWAREGSLESVATEAERVLRLMPEETDVAELNALIGQAVEIESSN